ncbi:MAG: Crp/Fnr family transcriptional regulator [Rhodobacterales bacterium]|nr:MAG: Crp/Fnr family transcriptional regulator [Rhodobacterales bacterium]
MTRPDPVLLRDLPAFASLDTDQIRAILDLATPRQLRDGAPVFHEGHDAELFFLLLDGHVRVVRANADGQQIIVLYLHSGSLIGIAVALGRDTYPATAIAAGDVSVLAWPSTLWEVFAAQYPGFARSAYATVGTRIGEMTTNMLETATQQVERRVACALERILRQSGRREAGGIVIEMPITRQNIADMTGATLHTISRLLSAWERDGLIRSARRRITVTDPAGLARLSGGLSGR